MVNSITIKHRSNTVAVLTGKITLKGTVRHDSGSVVLNGPSGSAFYRLYESYLERKLVAMCYGGSFRSEELPMLSFDFKKGLFGSYFNEGKYLRLICGKAPDEYGFLWLTGGRLVDIATTTDTLNVPPNAIWVSRAVDVFNPNVYYKYLAALEARLYRAVNWIIRRSFEFNVDERDSSGIDGWSGAQSTGLGPLLGTLLHIQANNARYNHSVWSATFATAVSSYSGAAAISIGYTNLDCFRSSVRIVAKLKYDGLVGSDGTIMTLDDMVKCPPIYTIYAMGTDVDMSVDPLTVSTKITRYSMKAIEDDTGTVIPNPDGSIPEEEVGHDCDGTGYLKDGVANAMTGAEIDITINGSPAFKSGQFYFAAFSVAIPVGIEEEFIPQDVVLSDDDTGADTTQVKMYHRYRMDTSWYLDDNPEPYTKSELIFIYASKLIK